MWRLTWRDLLFRRRRFVIAAASTALVFAVTVLMNGLLVAIDTQNELAVDRFAADSWWVPEGASGPFTSGPAMDATTAATFAALPGVTRAEPMLALRATVTDEATPQDSIDVNLVATEFNGLGAPTIEDGDGRMFAAPGEIVVSDELGYEVGQTALVSGHTYTVVGVATGSTFNFGFPSVFLSLADAQTSFARGATIASAIVVQGEPTATPPPGFVRWDRDDVVEDLVRVLGDGLESIKLVRTILLVTAMGIVAFIIYLSSLERTRDVAVLKATGATSRFLAIGLALQGVTITLGAALLAVVLAGFLEPLFPLHLQVTPAIHLQLAFTAVIVGLLASFVGVRRALSTDPALAFT